MVSTILLFEALTLANDITAAAAAAVATSNTSVVECMIDILESTIQI